MKLYGTIHICYFSPTTASRSHAKHANERSKAIPSGMNTGGIALHESLNYANRQRWVILFGYTSHAHGHSSGLEPSGYLATPRILEASRQRGQTGADVSRTFVHHPFRSGSRFIRARVRDYAAFPQSPRWFNLLFIRTVDMDTCSIRRDAGRRSRREINHLADKRDEVTNEVGIGGVLL